MINLLLGPGAWKYKVTSVSKVPPFNGTCEPSKQAMRYINEMISLKNRPVLP